MKTKKYYLFLLFTFTNLTIFSQTANWQFLKNAGGTKSEYCNDMCSDKNGNTIIVGESTSPTMSFGATTFTNPASSYPTSAIIAKYDSAGNIIWAKNYPGMNAYVAVNSVAVDSSNNILVIGSFGGNSLIIENTTLVNNTAQPDVFVAKFDPSGNLFWAKNYGGWSYDFGTSVAVDINNDILITGYFYADTLKMDNITLLNPNMGCFGDVFVAKLNSSTGNTIWANRAGGYGKDIPNCIKTDRFGNVYSAGETQVSTPMNFGSFNLTNASFSGMFIAKYDNNGQILWAKKAGGSFKDAFKDLTIDDVSGNIYAVGKHVGASPFDNIILPSVGYMENAFVAKYDSMGNVIWAKAILSAQDGFAMKVCHSSNGNIFVSGTTQDLSLMYDSITTVNTPNGLFLLNIDSQGNMLSSNNSITSGNVRQSALVSIDSQDNLFISGNYISKYLSLSPYSISNHDTNPSSNTFDIYFAKGSVNPLTTSVKQKEFNPTDIILYPNPANKYFSISNIKGYLNISVIDVNGNYILDKKVSANSEINIENIKPGMYSVKIEDGASILYKKLIIAR